MTTECPASAVVMNFAVRTKKMEMRAIVDLTPRTAHQETEELANGIRSAVNLADRLEVKPRTLSWDPSLKSVKATPRNTMSFRLMVRILTSCCMWALWLVPFAILASTLSLHHVFLWVFPPVHFLVLRHHARCRLLPASVLCALRLLVVR